MPLNLTRSILAILVPGGIAVAPWLILVFQTWPFLAEQYKAYPFLAHGLLFGIIVIIGTVLESIGSTMEERWDKQRGKEYSVLEHWYAYLSRSIDSEPVAHRYISRLVTRMYFQLTMTYATVLFSLGFATMAFLAGSKMLIIIGLVLIAVGMGTSIHFEIQAKNTHLELCEIRRELNTRLDAAPKKSA